LKRSNNPLQNRKCSKREAVVPKGDSGLFCFDTIPDNDRNQDIFRRFPAGRTKQREVRSKQMFNIQSDYALNKARKDAIICKSVTGQHTELTRANFSSEEEFQQWKAWSDDDYHKAENDGRNDDDCYSLDMNRDAAGLSLEDELISALDRASAEMLRQKATAAQVAAIKNILTQAQYRRVWMCCVEKLSMTEIAKREHVTRQRINKSLLDAYRRIVNNL